MSYVYFLSVGVLVMVIGFSGLMFSRIGQRSAAGADDLMKARLYAQSAIELGCYAIGQDPNWRSNLGSGDWYVDVSIGEGDMSLTATIIDDGDGNPANDSVVFLGVGEQGEAEYSLELTLDAMSDNGGMVISPGSGQRVPS